jgi:sugar O-acyltransferase (sialic acid O-acetyltransferase NeuD family)
MTTSLVVIGGGEHARVVIDAAISRPDLWHVRGFVDPEPCEATVRLLGVARIGGDEAIDRLAHDEPELRFVLGVGAVGPSTLRREIAGRFTRAGVRWATIIHSSASVSAYARVGDDVVVLAHAVLNAGSTAGDHVVLNTGAIAEHDVTLGEHVQLGPRATVGGSTSIGAGSYVGLGASIRDHVVIGRDALIAMGAVVVDDVPEGAHVRGIPARRFERG